MKPHLDKFSPLMQLLCMVLLANSILLALKLYALLMGQWKWEFLSVLTLGLTIFVTYGILQTRRMASRRINAIAETANNIIRTGDLSQRIPLGRGEMGSMTDVLNRMLAEIEQLMHGARTVSDNIAHDLRHPLTRLRNRLDELRAQIDPDACEEEERQLADLVAECDALLSTFQAILRISNIETARRHGGFREVHLNSVMQDVIDLYEPLATEKQITLVIDSQPANTVGDKDLLFQAFANLLDNAIKYTPAGGAISVTIAPGTQGGVVRIEDNGPGITPEHKPNVFRRFYRVDPSRSLPGTGLGLSLVYAIVKLHHGHIELSDAMPRGLAVTVTV